MVGDDSSESLAQQAAAAGDPGGGEAAAPLADTVQMPAGAFLLGASLDGLPPSLRSANGRLGLAALLDATPPVWCWLPEFRIGRQLVTNGQYRRFLEAPDPENPAARIADSRSLWEYVWQGLGLAIETRRVPIRDGTQLGSIEETYGGCETFVAAYMRSLRRDVERLLAGASLDGRTDGGEEAKFRARGKQTMVLSLPHHPLARSVFDDLTRALDEARQPPDPRDLATRIDELTGVLEPALRAARDPRRPDTRPPQPEAVVILRRARDVADRGEALAPSRVIYPREWPGPRGPTGLRFPGPRVPWEEQPVVGLTLHEAAGYAAWLALVSGRQVGLPHEAEWERAASWPVEPAEPPRAAQKALWPWWRDDDAGAARDFTHYFGHLEGGGVEGIYGDRREYRRVVEATARDCGAQGALHQLLGFCFQWTADRFDPRERRYARFAGGRYPAAPPVAGLGQPAFAYRAVTDVRHGDFVLRGAPALVGGPGLTTRRFAACPLRASRDIGFRIVVRED